MQDNQEDDIELDNELEDNLESAQEGIGSTEMYEHFRFVVDKGQKPLRVDKYLNMHMVHISRNRIQMAADANCVLSNGIPVKSNYKIKPLDIITVVLSYPRNEFEIIPQDLDLDIVYEDDDLFVVNKPAGLVVHPGLGNYEGTLANGIAFKLKELGLYVEGDARPGIVHRIDKDTSGLLVVAKNTNAKANLSLQFFNKTTQRKYYAVVWGVVKEDSGTIEGYIGRNPKNRMQMGVVADETQGKYAITHYRVIERYNHASLVECQLETGRTHQIRVHMMSIGHTLFNDERYGGNEILRGSTQAKYKQFINNCLKICPRQALHAASLGFKQPTSGEDLYFEAPLPEDMQQLIEKWKGYTVSTLV